MLEGDRRQAAAIAALKRSLSQPTLPGTLKRLQTGKFISPAANFLFSSAKPENDYNNQSLYQKFLTLMSLTHGQSLEPHWSIPIPRVFSDFAENRLRANRFHVGLCPGAGAEAKKWPMEFFLQIAKHLSQRKITPVFFLGPLEEKLQPEIANKIPSAIFPEADFGDRHQRSPLLTIALARQLAFSLVNDSGGGHLVAAGGGKTITLFVGERETKFKSPFCPQIPVNASDFGMKTVASLPYRPVLFAVDNALDDLLGTTQR